MTTSAQATLIYGISFPRDTPEFKHIDNMDWTIVEKLQAKGRITVAIQGCIEAEAVHAYVVGVSTGKVYSFQEPAKVSRVVLACGSTKTEIFEALRELGLDGTRETTFDWYIVAHLG